MNVSDSIAEILMTLEQMEIRLDNIRRTSQRATMIQRIQSGFKRAWTAAAAYICLLRAWGKP
jgi:hypothetical protein